jgi:ADP-ribosyl-[dinitrogen reductase] hydrolase
MAARTLTNMKLTADQLDRARATLVGAAAGDALGAGYEFELAPFNGRAEMIGGGLGDFAPFEWTDDTAQTYCVAAAAAEFHDLRKPEALDAVAAGIARWFRDDPPDVGNITRAVLTDAGPFPSAARLKGVAQHYYRRHDRSGGNGSLMRTAPVALAHLNDPWALVDAAYDVSYLTHGDPIAAEACAIWCLMLRESILLGGFNDVGEFVGYLPTKEGQDRWAQILHDAEMADPHRFCPNGYVVTALQAAWSSIRRTPVPPWRPQDHLVDTLNTVIGIGNDTDTVASIAGALLGARWGMSAIPADWVPKLHGWGNTVTGVATGTDLVELADKITAQR